MAKHRLTSISLWSGGMMAACSVSYAVNIDFIGGDISVYTLCVIFLSVLAIVFGEKLALILCTKRDAVSCNSSNIDKIIISMYKPSYLFCVFCTVYTFVVAWMSVQEMLSYLALQGHMDVELLSIVVMMRSALTDNEFVKSVPLQIASSISQAMAYVFLYHYLHCKILKKKNEYILLLPIIGYFVLLATTTGRTGFISFILVALAEQYIFMKKDFLSMNHESVFFKKAFLYSAYAVAAFFAYGYFLRNSDHSLADYFVKYFGIAIYGLDHVIEFNWPDNVYVGEYMLSNFYYYANKIFDTSFTIPAHHLPFFIYKTGESNIYTAILFPFHDFGLIGLFVINALIALIYTSIENKLLTYRDSFYNVLLVTVFAYMFYCNFSYPIANRYIEFLTVTTFPMLCCFILMVNYIYRHTGTFISNKS